jgi:steroid 5-alpha reductase family enzyme
MRIIRRNSKPVSLIILLAAYIMAWAVGLLIFYVCPPDISPVLSSLYADIGAALVIYLFSFAFNNSSFYDPYWSVAPFVLSIYWSVTFGNPSSFTDTIILLVILLWSFRLTLNFLRGWRGIRHEDWRYLSLKKQFPKYYWFVSLFGIHLLPTLIVFTAIMPSYVYLHRANIVEDFSVIFWGGLISIAGTVIELIADEQLTMFREKFKDHKHNIDTGVWKYSRHPNYFGEIIFWWGLWIMMMGVNYQFWWTFTGALAVTLMFIFISIPMMEKRAMQNKPGYKEYRQKVSMIIPWFQKKKKINESEVA